jgi:hypothetical protein
VIPAGSPPLLTDGGPGVSRFDLACDRHCTDHTTALIRRWGHDRALASAVVEDLCLVTCTALAQGIRLGPSSVCVRLRWADPDHVRVDVEWQGLDDGSTPGQSMIVDARSAAPRSGAVFPLATSTTRCRAPDVRRQHR